MIGKTVKFNFWGRILSGRIVDSGEFSYLIDGRFPGIRDVLSFVIPKHRLLKNEQITI